MQCLTAGHFLAVGLGAAVGAWLRWMLAIWLNQPGSAMPWGTVVANLVGGYLIGLAFGFFSTLPALPTFWRLFIVTGLLGGLTTFSTFSAETIALLEEGRFAMAALYSGVSLIGSLALTFLGLITFQTLRG
jgi:CrcB protein